MHSTTLPEYATDVMIGDVLYKILPESREIHVYDTEQGADDGIPSHMYTVARADWAACVADLLLRGTLV